MRIKLVNMFGSECYHHGILGQKWGVRRFQNADGSLTEAGKARYINGYTGSMTSKGKKASKTNPKIEEESLKAKEAIRENAVKEANLRYILENKKEFSTQEIQDALNRYEKENILSQKVSDLNTASIRAGLKKMDTMADIMSKSSRIINAGSDLYKSVERVQQMFETKNSKEELTLTRKEMDRVIKNPYGIKDSQLKKASTQSENIKKLYDNYNAIYKSPDGSYEKALAYVEKQKKKNKQ